MGQTKKIIIGSIVAIGLLGTVQKLSAEGFRNPPMTAENMAKSGASLVFIDDASAIQYNPANLVFVDKSSILYSTTIARSENTYIGLGGASAVSDAKFQPLPNLFFSKPIEGSDIAVGLGISTPYGQGVKYQQSALRAAVPPGAPGIYEAEMLTLNINPTIAFKLSDQLSIGVGASLYYSALNISQFFPWPQSAEVETTGTGFGANAGATWSITDKQRLAMTFRSGTTIGYEGDFKATPFPSPPGYINSDLSMDISYPNTIGLGYGIALTDKLQLEAAIEWLEWSVNDTMVANVGPNPALVIPQNWENTMTFLVGGEWQFAEKWALMFGAGFYETPIPDETIAPILPDMDRTTLSTGLSYMTEKHRLDLTAAYTLLDDRNIPATPGTGYPGTYQIDATLLNFTYAYSF